MKLICRIKLNPTFQPITLNKQNNDFIIQPCIRLYLNRLLSKNVFGLWIG